MSSRVLPHRVSTGLTLLMISAVVAPVYLPAGADVVLIQEEVTVLYAESDEEAPEPIENTKSDQAKETEAGSSGFIPAPRKRPSLVAPWGKTKIPEPRASEPRVFESRNFEPRAPEPEAKEPEPEPKAEPIASAPPADAEPPKLKLGIKSSGAQNELSLDSAPRGRFEGENPNVFEGEDLDLPPFLRKQK